MTTPPIHEVLPAAEVTPVSSKADIRVLVCVPFGNGEALQAIQEHLDQALPSEAAMIASPEATAVNGRTLLPYPAGVGGVDAGWALTASDYAAAAQLATEHQAEVTLILGAEAASMSVDGLRSLVESVTRAKADLVTPRYDTGPHDALVSSGILYPLTHALFGSESRLPLPLDVAFSSRMAARLMIAARRPVTGGQTADLVWPVAEAAMAGFVVREVGVGARTLPHPGGDDLSSLLADVVGSLFSDMEAKATFWQRARTAMPLKPMAEPKHSGTEEIEDVREMVESFRSAYGNLQEIWSLVLPPQSLLGWKRLSRVTAEEFEIPSSLWARTVYDFLLGYHSRAINRGHLLGSLTPLYLAWVASHLKRSAGDSALAAFHVDETAAAFVVEKPYVVARWRWPDRFNP